MALRALACSHSIEDCFVKAGLEEARLTGVTLATDISYRCDTRGYSSMIAMTAVAGRG
jgi:hypothetical protein